MKAEAGLIATAGLLLAGCTPVEMRGGHGGHEHLCRSEPLRDFPGRAGEAGTIEAARRAAGARTVRVLRQGEAMTMDFRPDRLTIVLDTHRIIERASCG